MTLESVPLEKDRAVEDVFLQCEKLLSEVGGAQSGMCPLSEGFRYRLFLIGSPRLVRSDGTDRTPSSLRARVLLAYLALMNGAPVERPRLQDIAWSNRPQIQGRDSLKKALSEIRRIFSADGTPQPLQTSGGPVALSLEYIDVDVLEETSVLKSDLASATFLEGVDLPDDPFNEWVQEVRRQMDDRRASAANSQWSNDGTNDPVISGLFGLALLPPIAHPTCLAQAHLALDTIIGHAEGTGLFLCYDFRAGSNVPIDGTRFPSILIALTAESVGTSLVLSLQARQAGSNRIIIADRANCATADFSTSVIDRFATQAIDRLCETLLNFDGFRESEHLASRNILAAVDHIFRLSNSDLDRAQTLLASAIEIAPRSTFYAWYAFLSAFQLEKHGSGSAQDLMDRTIFLANRALELDRHNPLTAALVGHSCCFVLKDMDKAERVLSPVLHMADRVSLLSDTLAMMHFYRGNYQTALSYGKKAAEIGRFHPFCYSFTTSVAMANLMLGKNEEAVANARRALGEHPVIGGHCYEPTMRTLAAACALTGRIEEGRAALETLRQQNRNFSAERLVSDDDARFPNPEALSVVKTGLEKLNG
ncbi:hypothetical protein [Vannielia sp. SX4]|uniref:hypothetical protein n=1 Tax=Vannielia sp. SX4 TaxID=3463852 RepID=UPI00405A2223